MNRSTRGSRRSPLWKDIFKTGKARNKSNDNPLSNKLAIPQELEDLKNAKKVSKTIFKNTIKLSNYFTVEYDYLLVHLKC